MQFQTGTLPDKGLGLERTSRLGAVMPSQKKANIQSFVCCKETGWKTLCQSERERGEYWLKFTLRCKTQQLIQAFDISVIPVLPYACSALWLVGCVLWKNQRKSKGSNHLLRSVVTGSRMYDLNMSSRRSCNIKMRIVLFSYHLIACVIIKFSLLVLLCDIIQGFKLKRDLTKFEAFLYLIQYQHFHFFCCATS